MPRPHKTKNAAPNQRDTRHENGLAAPGKRISKKSSNGQLNGQQVNGKPVSSAPPPALPTTGLNQGLRFPRPAESAVEPAPGLAVKDHAAGLEATPRDRTASEVSLDEIGLDILDNANEAASAAAAPCVEAQVPAAARRTSLSQAAGPLATMSTILTYYPLRDAISILILLLSLPPTLVLVIQSLFASLTFVPPTAGISLSTFPNIKEMFNASNLGYPALATILIVDFIFWAFWLPMWKPLQSIFLDFSQAVIAVSLSGAAASTGGPTYSIATTTLTVCLVHVLRYKAIHLTALDYLRSVIHKMDVGVQLDVPPIASSFLSPPSVERGWVFTVIRTILGIHIVSQGVTTCIRRSLVKANERDQTIPTITTNDSEVSLNAEPTSRPQIGNVDAQQPQTVTSSDGRPPGPPPLLRDGRPRESTTKRKKKQANQVRSQQPLWAAIASTKVTFVKEMEQRDAADDTREAAEMDRHTQPTFTSTIISPTDRIWITEVRDTEVYFSVQLASTADEHAAAHGAEDVTITAGIDKSKPFFIRINGAAWTSARIMSSATGDEANGKPCYDGEVFGLAPRSTFLCEVVDISIGTVLCSLRFITEAAPSAEQMTSAAAQPRDHHPRPASPSTTLRQSIQTATAKLTDARNKAKKVRREQKAAITDLRKDINNLKKKLKESSEEDRQKQKMQQYTQHKSQAEEAVAEVKRELESFGDIPDHEVADLNQKRQLWTVASNAKRSAEETFHASKAEADRELNAIKTEMEASKTKRERMEARHAQRVQEYEKLESKQQADMSAKQRRELERARIADGRRQEDWQFRSQISGMENEISALMDKSQETYQQLAALQSWNTAPPAYPGYSSPPTPEGTLSGTNGTLGSPHTNGFASHGPQSFQSPFHSAQPSMSNNNHGPRGRSSSMLSQYSGFTDNGDEYSYAAEQPVPVHQFSWPMQPSASAGAPIFDDRKESEGSGSLTTGSTGSNSPRPDANPFIPAANKAGTIGPPSKNRDKVVSQSPQGAIGSGR